MVLKKCHFDDLFKKVLEEIETQFDKDFELEISPAAGLQLLDNLVAVHGLLLQQAQEQGVGTAF